MISLIITTAPGREENLDACLKSIANQSLQPAEVIVTDDGNNGKNTAEKWTSILPIRYLSRPNDRCVSRSRNLAVNEATQDYLVFLDGDILLNPDGLKAYQAHFEALPDALLGGYFGNIFHHVSPSYFYKNREINYVDKRFEACLNDRFYPFIKLLQEPAFCCWSGNIGISRHHYNAIKGFNENLRGWGSEDVDFSVRAITAGLEIHFCIDTWGEHQIHCRNTAFHQKTKTEIEEGEKVFKNPHPPIDYQVRVLGHAKQVKNLHHRLMSFYTQQDPEVTPSIKAKFMKTDAAMVIRNLADESTELGCAFKIKTPEQTDFR